MTYELNRLQRLGVARPTLFDAQSDEEIDPAKCFSGLSLPIPFFPSKSIESQRRFNEINGVNRVSYCGAYWGYGFHEDGVNSALAVVRDFGLSSRTFSIPFVDHHGHWRRWDMSARKSRQRWTRPLKQKLE